jgi:hypothetical protein
LFRTGIVFDLPSLTSLGALQGWGSTGCTLNLPALTTITGNVNFTSITGATVDLTSLVSVATTFIATGSPNLSLNLPSLVHVGSAFDAGNSTITFLDLSSFVPVNGTSINFGVCNLTAPMIEQLFRRAVLSGVTNYTIDVSNGTNAGLSTLSAQGQTDYATLIGAGNTVAVNP